MDEKRLHELERDARHREEAGDTGMAIKTGDVRELIAEIRRLRDELEDQSAAAGAALCVATSDALLLRNREEATYQRSLIQGQDSQGRLVSSEPHLTFVSPEMQAIEKKA